MKFSVFSLFRASAIFCFLAALGAAQQTTVLYDASTYEQKRPTMAQTLGNATNLAAVNAVSQPLDAALTALAGGSDFVQFTGPATSTKVFTLPDASSTLLFSGGPLGMPSSGTLTNATGLPVSTGISGLGTGVATALAVNVGSAGAPVIFNGAGGTPSSLVGTNITGTASGLTAGNVTTNANLTGDVTSVGNASTLATVNANTGSFGSSTAIPSFTVNGKGLITAASTNAVIAPAGTLTGTTLASNVVSSSLTTVGALNSGSITSGFGSIDIGADSLTAGAGSFTTLAASGAISTTVGSTTSVLTASGGTTIVGNVASGNTQIYASNGVVATLSAASGLVATNINGTPIGASTPAAGSFTTLAASGASSFPGFKATKTTATSGFLAAADEGANTYNTFTSRNNADNAYLPLVVRAGTYTIANASTDVVVVNSGAVAITGTLGASGNVWSGNNDFPLNSGSTDGAFLDEVGAIVVSRNSNPTGSFRRRSSDGSMIDFYRDTTNVGSISVTTTATAYNTSSDARLKNSIKEVDHAKVRAIVNDIRIRDYLWNANDKAGLGPIAQELAAVHPLMVEIGAVTPGDGQQVDYAAWRARKARVDARADRNEQAKKAHKLAVEAHQKEVQRITKANEESREADKESEDVTGFVEHPLPDAPAEPVLESDPEDAEKDFVQWQVDLSKLTPFLIDYAQQESKRLDALEARILALEKK